MKTEVLPPALAEIVDSFATLPPRDRLELLLEYSQSIPPLPARFAEHPERLEAVPECQSPLFVAAEVGADGRVEIAVNAPPEAPTTRGFAGIFHAGLNGLPAEEILGVPGDVTARLTQRRGEPSASSRRCGAAGANPAPGARAACRAVSMAP